jgi:ankyrin repeat protein
MLCVKKPHWMVSLIAVTIVLLGDGLCMAQGRADTTDYIAELNKLGMAGRPESDNAAPFYEKAIELYVQLPADLKISTRTMPKELPAQEQAVLRKWVQDNSAALEQVQLGSQKPYCWFMQTEQITQSTSLRSIKISDLPRVLSFRAKLKAEDGNVAGAISDIVTLYKLGTHNEAGPKLLIEKLIGINIKGMAVTVALNILSETPVNADLMKGLQEQLERLSPKQNEPFDVRGETIHMRSQIETDPKAAPLKPYLQNALEYYDTIAAKTPWQLHNEKEDITADENPLIKAASITRIVEFEYRSRTDTQALITTLAVMRYKNDKGTYPAALPELVRAGYIKELPTDPFSNNPLVYKQTRESFALYSFGADYDDDGGDIARDSKGNVRMWADEGDAVFWPVQLAEGAARQVAEQRPERKPLPVSEQEKLTESLHRAVIADDIDQVESIMSKGADINGRGRQNWTPLHSALFYGTQEMAELLISKGADVNAQDERGNTPLHFAAIKGKNDAASLLIDKGVNINAKTQAGQTPLFLAADKSRWDIVKLLVSKGADVNAQVGSENALSIARRKNNNEIVDLLLKHGATEPAQIMLADGPYGRGVRAGGLSTNQPGGPDLYQGFEGQAQRGSSRFVSSRTGDEILADANEIKARVKTYMGLEKSLEEIDSKGRLEKSAWLQRRIDNRASLIRLVEEQVKSEMTFVRKIAAEEKAEETIKITDDVLSKREELTSLIRKELLAQRREQREAQNPRGRGAARGGRGTRGRGAQEGYTPGQQLGQEIAGPYGRRGESDEGEQLDSEIRSKIDQWLQTTLDNRETLLQAVYTDVREQYASIRAPAVEEEAKKTMAAIDGILLNREMRLGDIVLKMEEAAEREAQGPRGRNLRTPRGRFGQDGSQPGQGQYMDESSARSRRR